MADPAVIAQGFTGMFAGMGGKIVYWLGYGILIFGSLGVLYLIYLFTQYKYKAEIYIRRGSGKDEEFTIGRVKSDRIREIKKNGIPMWQLLFSRKTLPTVKDKYILPGNRVKLFQVNKDNFVPVTFSCGNPEAVFSPLPQSVRVWQQLEMQRAAQEYREDSTWSKYGGVIVMTMVVIFCLGLVGVTIYFTYQHANQVAAALAGVSNNIKKTTILEGIAPG